MSSPTVYELLRTFDTQNKFDGTNYNQWIQEFEMTFGEDVDLMAHVKGTSDKPKDPTAVPAWLSVDSQARIAMYKTISSNSVRSTHFKTSVAPADPQTAAAVWNSLKAEYQKDSRASRFDLKKRLYNPVHDTSQPISHYIQDIVSAADSLTALGHPPAATDVVDSILMNLDSSFAVIRTMLTSQPTEPTLDIVKKMLVDQEDERRAISGDGLVEGALYSKKSKSKPKKDDSDSDDGTWLNPENEDACHRCGRKGHRSSRCMLNMPQHIKDKIMKEARQRRKGKSKRRSHSSSSSDESPERSNAVRFIGNEVHLPSDSDSLSDSDDGLDPYRLRRGSDSESPERALASQVLNAQSGRGRSSKQARRILARLQA